jgi:hypothetical protein
MPWNPRNIPRSGNQPPVWILKWLTHLDWKLDKIMSDIQDATTKITADITAENAAIDQFVAALPSDIAAAVQKGLRNAGVDPEGIAKALTEVDATIAPRIAALKAAMTTDADELDVTPTSISATVGGSTPFTMSVAGGVGPFVWSIDAALEGVTLNSDGTGIYAPTVAASTAANVSVTDGTTPSPLTGSASVTFTAT